MSTDTVTVPGAGTEQGAVICHPQSPDLVKLRSCNFTKSGDLIKPEILGNSVNT